MSSREADPIALFASWQAHAGSVARGGIFAAPVRWIAESLVGRIPEADAAALATASPSGAPSVRMVLVRQLEGGGFAFYTNYGSRKAAELDANPYAALVFHFPFPPRQVRIEGDVTRLRHEESERYWSTRHRGSQISAMASRQSEVVSSRDDLVREVDRLERTWADKKIPCPEYWGGYRLDPRVMEFWEGKPDRLHDRWRYVRNAGSEGWIVETLAP